MKRIVASLALLASSATSAHDAFQFDHRLALELSRAYLRSSGLQHPGASARISSAIAAHRRHLVFVTFAGPRGAGAFVELELCAETHMLTAAGVGTVDNLEAYRADVGRITSKTFVAIPAVCAAEVP